jgi:hypothetical protein
VVAQQLSDRSQFIKRIVEELSKKKIGFKIRLIYYLLLSSKYSPNEGVGQHWRNTGMELFFRFSLEE